MLDVFEHRELGATIRNCLGSRQHRSPTRAAGQYVDEGLRRSITQGARCQWSGSSGLGIRYPSRHDHKEPGFAGATGSNDTTSPHKESQRMYAEEMTDEYSATCALDSEGARGHLDRRPSCMTFSPAPTHHRITHIRISVICADRGSRADGDRLARCSGTTSAL